MRSPIAAAVALLLAACGLAGPSAEPSRIVVMESTATNGHAGWTEWGDGPTEVRIYPATPDDFFHTPDRTAAIIAHELWHAMTLDSGHAPSPDCMSHDPVRVSLLTERRACQEDVESVPPGKTWRVDAGPFLEETRAALHYWNAALGREVLVLED
jgi:hypothetical protein